MQIASRMAGFSLGEADLLRRAVSKKKREVLDQEREHFVRGCIGQGYDESVANEVYDMIVRFADYGFPRAHATAYGVLAYQTAYLKAHYPAAFMASMLTAVMGSHRKVAEYIDECRKMGIAVLPPDVNESDVLFTPLPNGSIRFGLAAIKNVGTNAMESIIAERRNQPYRDLLDFCMRVDLRACNKRVVESLIMGGAFDSLPGHRAQLIAMLDETMEAAQKWKKERDDLQLSLFGFTEAAQWTIEPPDVRPFQRMEQLEMERELLGLYLSGHPLDEYADLMYKLELDPLLLLPEYADGSEVVTAGMIVSVKPIFTKKGQQMAFAELEDQTAARAELVLFPAVWQRCGEHMEKGQLVIVRGKLQLQDEDIKLIVDDADRLDVPYVEERFKRRAESRRDVSRQRVFIKIPSQREQPAELNRLKQVLVQHPGTLPVVLFYERTHKVLALKEDYRVQMSERLKQQIEAIMGPDSVRIH